MHEYFEDFSKCDEILDNPATSYTIFIKNKEFIKYSEYYPSSNITYIQIILFCVCVNETRRRVTSETPNVKHTIENTLLNFGKRLRPNVQN